MIVATVLRKTWLVTQSYPHQAKASLRPRSSASPRLLRIRAGRPRRRARERADGRRRRRLHVLAAQAVGVTGVLVRTGKFTADALERPEGSPDHVVDSFADVPALLDLW
nr:HAD hydrolase-like protein [Cryptosporangium aurantiacum]